MQTLNVAASGFTYTTFSGASQYVPFDNTFKQIDMSSVIVSQQGASSPLNRRDLEAMSQAQLIERFTSLGYDASPVTNSVTVISQTIQLSGGSAYTIQALYNSATNQMQSATVSSNGQTVFQLVENGNGSTDETLFTQDGDFNVSRN